MRLRLQHNYFFGLAKMLVVQDFPSGCACACSATFLTCAAHIWKEFVYNVSFLTKLILVSLLVVCWITGVINIAFAKS